MDIENFIKAQKKIILLFHEKSNALEKIKNSKDSLIFRWQDFIGIVLPVQIQVIQAYGYSGDQIGLSRFNEDLMQLSLDSPTLQNLNEEKWRFLFKKAFGITEYKEISLSDAQKLINDIANAMVSIEFLEEIDMTFEKLTTPASTLDKRQKLLEILLPLHMSIMSKNGFNGERGYIQAQRALMDYYFDPLILEKSKYAQKVVFERANLL